MMISAVLLMFGFLYKSDFVTSECNVSYCNTTNYCNDSYCAQCLTGYYWNGQLCDPCFLYCRACFDSECYDSVTSSCSEYFSTYDNCDCSVNVTYCSRCPDGFYLSNHRCFRCNYIRCKCKTASECDQCLPGYWGTSNFCNFKCPNTCVSCINTLDCETCIIGKYGSKCELDCIDKCLDGTCNKTSGLCSNECNEGEYMDQTCKTCPGRCTSCISYTECTNCRMHYYWGAACEYDCAGCLNNCNTTYGCISACADARYYYSYNDKKRGYECLTCPENCSECDGSRNCVACKPGYWGNICQYSCNHCSSTCDKDVGCGAFCSSGYYPDSVDSGYECKSCPAKCDECTDAFECSICEEGYYVNDIKQCVSCSVNCKDFSCYSTNGTCTAGCQLGQAGYLCNDECPLNCFECDQFNLSQCSRCKKGFFGESCTMNCSRNCKTQIGLPECYQNNGTCLNGCEDGFWSRNCSKQCIEGCGDHRCDETTGLCLETSETTSEKIPDILPKRDDNGDGEIVLPASAAAGAVVVIIVIVVIVVLLLRRRRRENGKPEKEVDGVEKDEMVRKPNTYDNANDANPDSIILNEYSPVIKTKTTENVRATRDNFNKMSPKTSTKKHERRTKEQNDETAGKTRHDENVETTFRVDSPLSTPENLNVKDNSANSVNNSAQIVSKDAKFSGLHEQSVSNTGITGKSGHNLNKDEGVLIENDVDHLKEGNDNVDEEGNMYYNTVGRRVNVAELAEYVSNKSWEDIMEEFEKLPKGLLKSYSVSQTGKNAAKNRYKLIYPYDESRIVLQDGGNDYVNASYIEGYNRPKEYIAAAGPFKRKDKTETTTDFWRMIWQEKCETVVMLTKCFENAEQKCDQYWPELGEKNAYGKVHVTCVTEDQYADFTVRSFIATQDETALNIRQIHFTAWPDKGVPHDVTCLIECRQKVRSLHRDRTSPIIVHCSAGIGRTGTFIALDILTFMGEATGYVDIFGCLMNLRQQRVNLVQTPDQYDYLHEAVLHALTFDCKTIPAEEFITYYSTIVKKKDGSNQLEQQFQKLTSTLDVLSLEEREAIARNKALTDKNRSGADIPSDDDRVRLSQDRKHGSSDYINAVFLNGFKTCNKFIVAQTPLPTTIDDFMSMISQSDCSCVVMVENPDLEDKTVGVFWPADNQVIKHGIFQVKCMESLTNENYTMKKLSITRRAGKKEEGRLLNLFIFTNWPSDAAAPKSSDSLLQLIKDVDKANSTDDNERPIILNCMTGATRSCLYCAVSVLIEKMEIEHEVSVVNTLRQIKSRRRSAFPTLEQYKFCHQAVISYLQTFATYSNFELKQGSKKEVAADDVYATVQK